MVYLIAEVMVNLLGIFEGILDGAVRVILQSLDAGDCGGANDGGL